MDKIDPNADMREARGWTPAIFILGFGQRYDSGRTELLGRCRVHIERPELS